MKVDRARFLALTLTIAAGGCGVQPSRGPSGRSRPAPPVAIPPATGAADPAAGPDDGAVAPDDAPVDVAAALRDAPALPEDFRHLSPDQQVLMRLLLQLERSNTGCGPVRPPHPPPPPGWMAEEPPPRPLVGYAAQCMTIKGPPQMPGPHCEYWSLDCEDALSALKPPAARKALECLRRKDGTRAICGYNVVTDCVLNAVRASVGDRRVAAACEHIVQSCRGKAVAGGATPVTTVDCRGYLAGVDCPETQEAGFCLSEVCALEPCINPLW